MDGANQSDEHGYRVLARKYRPTRFDDLFGQDSMVQTLSNAFKSGRIAQAWMLTGVRGVGKTTTARILARALNYEIPDKIDQPTIDMPEPGLHCQAIMEGRHVDVIEMDAASHTGINDIREITEAARYKPVSARYKVYIIDEVHMLSNQAFNGLLKTLEEPPEHVKFLFATTEIRKVPVTVLSRCQRFDLRRIDADLMVQFLQKIADAESVGIEPEALSMIARAAEGSARDALSLLDQAIAHGAETVASETVRSMLGLADRARVIDLFESVMGGDIAGALEMVKEQFDIGAEPVVILTDLAEYTHLVTKFKISSDYEGGQAVTEMERSRGREFAGTLSMRVLSRAWQILLKGIAEVQSAPRPLAAADMVLVRLCYAADLPTPDEVVRQARGETGEIASGSANAPASAGQATPLASAAQSESPSVVQTAPKPDTESGTPAPAPVASLETSPGASFAASNVVSAAFGQSGAAALRKVDPSLEPDIQDGPELSVEEAFPSEQANPLEEPVPATDNVVAERSGPAQDASLLEDAPPDEEAALVEETALVEEIESQANTADTDSDPGPAAIATERPAATGDDEKPRFQTFSSLREMADLLGQIRDLKLKFAVERQVRPVSMEPGKLEISVETGAPPDLAARLGQFMLDHTGQRWMIVVSREAGGQTLHEIEKAEQAREMSDAAGHPDVAAVLNAFPGARIVDVRISPRDGGSDEAGAIEEGLEDPDSEDPDLED